MKTSLLHKTLLASVLALGASPVWAQAISYEIDPSHTNIVAQWNHLGFSNPTAHFGGATGVISYDAKNPEKAKVEVVIPLSHMTAYSVKFDEHLFSSDFFDKATFPQATFESTKVESLGGNKMRVTGILTIKEHKKPVVLDVTVNKVGTIKGKPAIGFDAFATIKRSDFGLGMAAPAVSDEVTLRITTEAHHHAEIEEQD